ncbi:MAG: hypothetical protein WBW14_19905, partial [Candidatus Acidiferrum sp.]
IGSRNHQIARLGFNGVHLKLTSSVCAGGIVEKVQEEQEQKSRLELAVIEISFHHVGKGMVMHTKVW